MKGAAADKIKRLEAEIKHIKKYIIPLEEVGISASFVTGMLLSIEAETKEDIRKIISVYQPSELSELTFAGKDPLPTKSPFNITVDNWSAEHFPTIKIRYQSNEVKVWIKVPKEFFPHIGRTEETKQVQRGRESYTQVIGYNYYIPITNHVQRYGGGGEHFGSRVTYAKTDEDAEAILEAIGLGDLDGSESHTAL